MTDTQLSILPVTLLDQSGDHRLEFDAEGSGELYQFALSYSVLEALTGTLPEQIDDPAALVLRHQDRIAAAAAKALARGPGIGRVVIDEGDLV